MQLDDRPRGLFVHQGLSTKNFWAIFVLLDCFTNSGLPLGQEKSGNQEKSGIFFFNDKSQEKIGNFEEKSGNLIKF